MSVQFSFGKVHYTAAEIFKIGQRHKQDGIEYYPPSCWGVEDGEYGTDYGGLNNVYKAGYDSTTKYGPSVDVPEKWAS